MRPAVSGHTNYFVDIRKTSYDIRSMTSRSRSKEPAPPPLPTDAEIAILAVLWRQGASTVREVHEVLGKDSGYTTTLKLLQLMFEKSLVLGALAAQPASSKDLDEIRSLLDELEKRRGKK